MIQLLQGASESSKKEGSSVKTPPVLQRYEAKYTIPSSMVKDISNFIKPYCSLDTYSESSPDNFYKVNSLYFDTPDYLFLRNRMTETDGRFNMRIRSYGSEPQLPYFFEIKQKRGGTISKFRSKLNNSDIIEALETWNSSCEGKPDKNTNNANLFRRLVKTYNASPKVLVQYRRKAYFSIYDEYARVTFDKELRYMPRLEEYYPIPVEEKMISCDGENVFDQGCNVILELKCYTSYVPLWMLDLIRVFNLRQRAFSKYATCLIPVLLRYRYSDAAMASTLQYIYSQEFEEGVNEAFS